MRKRGKKEIIVKTVFTCIFIFMLWWAFLMWERFASDVAVGKQIDDVGMLMLWYDIQNRRYIPEEAKIQSFDLQLNDQKEIVKFDFTVQEEMLSFTYKEQEDGQRIFEQTSVGASIKNDLKASTFFRAIQVLQIEKKFVEGTKILFKENYTNNLSAPNRMWKIEDEVLTEIPKDLEGNSNYQRLFLESNSVVEWVYVKNS